MRPYQDSVEGILQSPSLEIFQNHLDVVLDNLLEQGAGPDDLQRSLPTSTIL